MQVSRGAVRLVPRARGGCALLFQGQGSVRVGMASSARTDAAGDPCGPGFGEVDVAQLRRTMDAGPLEALVATDVAQPALVLHGVALARELARALCPGSSRGGPEDRGGWAGVVRCVAGHSAGEYTALAVAGVISACDAVAVAQARGRAMLAAANRAHPPAAAAKMVACMGLTADEAREAVASYIAANREHVGRVSVANDNGGGQIVLSGASAAVDGAVEFARARLDGRPRRAVALPVRTPFHCPLLRAAEAPLAARLASTAVRVGLGGVRWISNASARAEPHASEDGAERVRALLVSQVCGPVRWAESVRHMWDDCGVRTFVEIGPAAGALTRLLLSDYPLASTHVVSTADEAHSVALQLSKELA